jgi:hypothetical protein
MYFYVFINEKKLSTFLNFKKIISEIKYNIKMQESKCFDSLLTIINMLKSEHLVYRKKNGIIFNGQMAMESKNNL